MGVGLAGIELDGLAEEIYGFSVCLAVEGFGAGLGEGAGLCGVGLGVGLLHLLLDLLEELFGFLVSGRWLGLKLTKCGKIFFCSL